MDPDKWERTSPFGLLRFAYEYREAAQLVHDARVKDTPSMPAYSLMGQSIELALKSYLRARGMTVEALQKKVGHSLTKGYRRARELGLLQVVELHDINSEAIHNLSDAYAGHRFRYIQNGMMTIPPWDQADLTATLLINGLHDYAVTASFGDDALKQRRNWFPKKGKAPVTENPA